MPFRSEAQRGAMFAAASGKSTLGIPETMGKEFVRSSEGRKIGTLPRHLAPKSQRYVLDGQYRRVKS